MDTLDAGAATGFDNQRFGLLLIDGGTEAHDFHATKTRAMGGVEKGIREMYGTHLEDLKEVYCDNAPEFLAVCEKLKVANPTSTAVTTS